MLDKLPLVDGIYTYIKNERSSEGVEIGRRILSELKSLPLLYKAYRIKTGSEEEDY